MPDCIEDTPGCIVCFDYRAKYGRICQFGDWTYQYKGCCEAVFIDNNKKLVVIHNSKLDAIKHSWFYAILFAGTISVAGIRYSKNFPDTSAEDMLRIESPPEGRTSGRYLPPDVAEKAREYTIRTLTDWFDEHIGERAYTVNLRVNREVYPGVDGLTSRQLRPIYEIMVELLRRAGLNVGSEVEQCKAFSIHVLVDERVGRRLLDLDLETRYGLHETSFRDVARIYRGVWEIYEESLLDIDPMSSNIEPALRAFRSFSRVLRDIEMIQRQLRGEITESEVIDPYVLITGYGTYSYRNEWEAFGETAEIIIGDRLRWNEYERLIEMLEEEEAP